MEIKHRQPIFDKGRFLRWHYWGFIEKGVFVGPMPPFDRQSFMFTGLHDKNGKEIWEGDLCKDSTIGTFIVEWDERFASFCLTRNRWMFQHFFGEAVEAEETEVIGNIYEEGE